MREPHEDAGATHPESTTGVDPGRRADGAPRGTIAECVLTGVAVLSVTLSPFTIALGRGPWMAALWLDVVLTAVAGVLLWPRKGVGCFEIVVPLVATTGVVASTAARPGEVGPWLPALQALGLAVVVLGARSNDRRFGGSTTKTGTGTGTRGG